MAYLDDFRLLALIVLLITPLVFFLKTGAEERAKPKPD
jgi:hypothetical protein